MADLSLTPVASQIKPPQQMSLADIMNVARGAQAYQQSQQVNPLLLQKAQQEAYAAQSAQQDQQALRDFMSNQSNYMDDSGNIDLQKAQNVMKVAPTLGPKAYGDLAVLSKNQTDATEAKQALGQKSLAIIAGPIGVLGRAGVNDLEVYSKEFDNILALHPGDKNIEKLVRSYQSTLKMVPPGGNLAQFAIRASEGLLNPTEARTAFAPTATLENVGGAYQPVQKTPSVGGQAPAVSTTGAPIPIGLTTPEQVTTGTDLTGQPYQQIRDPKTGQIIRTAPMPGSTNAPTLALPAGESTATLPEVQKIRTDSNAAASRASTSHFNNQEIEEYARRGFTGTLSPVLANAAGVVGGASDTANLQHYIALQRNNAEQAMGANTDASRAATESVVGSATTPEKALIRQTKVNDAFVTGTELFNQGLEIKLNDPNNKYGPWAARQFRNEWADNFDPRAMIMINAQKEKQQKGRYSDETQDLVNSVMNSVGYNPQLPADKQSFHYKELLRKVKNLDSLSTKGSL